MIGQLPGRVPYQPLKGAGLALFNAELGLPVGTVIPDPPAFVDGSPIIVAGFNSFMLSIAATGPGPAFSYEVWVSHCDPGSGNIILRLGTPVGTPVFGAPRLVFFAAFTPFVVAPILFTSGHVWHTIRLSLRISAAGGGGVVASVPDLLNGPLLFAGTR